MEDETREIVETTIYVGGGSVAKVYCSSLPDMYVCLCECGAAS